MTEMLHCDRYPTSCNHHLDVACEAGQCSRTLPDTVGELDDMLLAHVMMTAAVLHTVVHQKVTVRRQAAKRLNGTIKQENLFFASLWQRRCAAAAELDNQPQLIPLAHEQSCAAPVIISRDMSTSITWNSCKICFRNQRGHWHCLLTWKLFMQCWGDSTLKLRSQEA